MPRRARASPPPSSRWPAAWYNPANGIDPIFVGYELLCREPAQVCDRLGVLLNVPRESIRFEARESRTGEPPVADRALLTRAHDLYSTLQEASRAALLT